MATEFDEKTMGNFMLHTYLEQCGLTPSEIIEAVVRYKSMKNIGLASKVGEQVEMFKDESATEICKE